MEAGKDVGADLVLIDVGPNLGALNRAALVAAEDVIIPLAPDLYSLQGLRNLGLPCVAGGRDGKNGWNAFMAAVQDGYRDFRALAKRIAKRCKIARP